MPTVTGYGQSLNMADLFTNSNFLQSVGVSGSSTAFTTQFLTERWEFNGSFSNFSGTIPLDGTISTFRFYWGNELVLTASNLGLPIPILFGFMSQADLVGLHNWIFFFDDTINGSTAGDNLLGYGGNDIINGGDGDDAITPGPGIDQVNGGAGIDILYLDRSTSTVGFTFNTGLMRSDAGQLLADGSLIRNMERFNLTGGSGNDTFNVTEVPTLVDASAMIVNGGAGYDTLIADLSSVVTTSFYLQWSNIESLQVSFGSEGERIFGGTGDDVINGGGGNDEIFGNGGTDILDGGDGVDMVSISFAGVTSNLVFTLNGFNTAQGVTFANGAIVRNAETVHITGGSGNDTLDLGTGFVGNSGSFSGGGGIDTVTGNFSASNQAVTLDENGFVRWQSPHNYVQTTAERYIITGSSADDVLSWLGGADQLDGGTGNDTLRYNAGWLNWPQSVIIDAGIFAGLSTAGGATLSNGAVFRNFENLQIILSFRDDVVRLQTGFAGGTNNNIDGYDGFDTLEANFAGEARSLSLDLNSLSIGGTLTARFTNMERLVVTGGDSFDLLRGGSGADIINGGLGHDYIQGDRGADTLNGGDGDDIIYGSYQGHSNDPPPSDDGADIISGGAGDDILIGGAGADFLDGGDGNDRIYYDAADNPANVIGSAGADTLVFTTSSIPSSFDLDAHGFERAEQQISDTGLNPWSSRITYFDAAWRVDYLRTNNDDGSYSQIDYDQLGAFNWTTDFNEYDTLGRRDVNVTVFDSGITSAYDFDQASAFNWVSNWNQYTASNALDINETIFDNGVTTSMDFDADNAFNWTSNWLQHDANGLLDLNETVYDSGVTSSYDYDQADAFIWSSNWNQYAPGGALDINVTVFDDGSSSSNDFDQANAFTWASTFNSYVIGGALDYTITNHDNGNYAVLDYDQGNAFTWATIWQLYDPNGVLLDYRGVNDDGSLFGGP